MMRLLSVPVVLLLAGVTGRAQEDLKKLPISPLVDGQTFAVVHVRLDKLDAGRMTQLAAKVAALTPLEAAMAEAATKLALLAVTAAGAKDVYGIASLDGFPFEMGYIAIPVASEQDGKRIASALKLTVGLRELTDGINWGEFGVQTVPGFVVIAHKNTARRLQTLQPVMPPHLAAALASFPKAEVRLGVVLPDTLRRSLGELVPQLPTEVGGGKTAPLLDGFQYFAAGITLAPKFSVEGTLQTADPRTADRLHGLLGEVMKLARKEVAGQEVPDPKVLAQVDKIIPLLTPTAEKGSLHWKFSEAELIQAVGPLAAQVRSTSGRTQSINNLKQIALAMHNFNDSSKHFPSGIRDKQGKLLLSWRVQLLPFVDQYALYKQFKLDEAWDSPHNLKLAQQMPAVYRSPTSKADAGKTVYLVPVGKGLFFDPEVPARKILDILDGTSNTVMVLEANDDQAVPWTKPADLDVDVKDALRGLGGNPAGQFQAAFADGSVRVLNRKLGAETFYKMLTVAGGEVLP
jgi:hypothetical protein